MGIGGALIMPSTLSILTNVFREPKERGRAIAIWAGFSGMGVAIGPILGGILLEHFSWHSVFWVNIPLGVAALVLGAFIVPKSRDPRQSRFDPLGAVLSIVGLASLLYGIIEGQPKGWTRHHRGRRVRRRRPVARRVRAVGVAQLGPDARHDRVPQPAVLRRSGTITMVFFALFGSLFLMTQYWQLVHGYTPLEAAIRLLPYAATMMVVAPLSARAVEHAGTKRVVLLGLTLITTGLLLLSTIEPETPYPVVISFFVVMAAGMGMTMAPATESVMGALPREKAGVGSAVNDTTRQVGGALGVAIIGSVVSGAYAGRIATLASAVRASMRPPAPPPSRRSAAPNASPRRSASRPPVSSPIRTRRSSTRCRSACASRPP